MIRPRALYFPVSITTAGTRRSEDGKLHSEPFATITIYPIYRNTLIGSRALTALPKQYRYNVVAHSPLEQPDETPDTLPAR